VLTIDASVLVAAAIDDEPAHEAATALLREAGRRGATIHEPAIALVEVVAGIVRRTGDLQLAATAMRLLASLPGAAFHDLDLPAAVQTAGVAGELRLRAGDAIYAAVAHESGSALVTLDEELLRRAVPLVRTFTPEAWIAAGGGARH
jgi:predicted nucleic acid-binding protein